MWRRDPNYFYRNLWEWINRPFDTPPEPALQLQLNLDSIGASVPAT